MTPWRTCDDCFVLTAREAERQKVVLTPDFPDVQRCARHEPRERVNRKLWNYREDGRSGGVLDEIVLHDVDCVHIEQMNDRCWWIALYLDDDRRWSGNFVADSRGRMGFYEQDDDVEWDRDDSHEEPRTDDARLSSGDATANASTRAVES